MIRHLLVLFAVVGIILPLPAMAHQKPAPKASYKPAPRKSPPPKKVKTRRKKPAKKHHCKGPKMTMLDRDAKRAERKLRRKVRRQRQTRRSAPRRLTIHYERHEHQATVVKTPLPANQSAGAMSFGVRATGTRPAGMAPGLGLATNPAMGGIGFQFRTRFTDHVGLELSADIVGSEDREVEQITVPLMASATYHFFPESPLQPYALGGVGVHLTEVSLVDGQLTQEITEPAAQIGAGLELFITGDISLHADIRGNATVQDSSGRGALGQQCVLAGLNGGGLCDDALASSGGKRMNVGAQLGLGASFHF